MAYKKLPFTGEVDRVFPVKLQKAFLYLLQFIFVFGSIITFAMLQDFSVLIAWVVASFIVSFFLLFSVANPQFKNIAKK